MSDEHLVRVRVVYHHLSHITRHSLFARHQKLNLTAS